MKKKLCRWTSIFIYAIAGVFLTLVSFLAYLAVKIDTWGLE